MPSFIHLFMIFFTLWFLNSTSTTQGSPNPQTPTPPPLPLSGSTRFQALPSPPSTYHSLPMPPPLPPPLPLRGGSARVQADVKHGHTRIEHRQQLRVRPRGEGDVQHRACGGGYRGAELMGFMRLMPKGEGAKSSMRGYKM